MFYKSLLPSIVWAIAILVLIMVPGSSFGDTSWLKFPHFDKLVHFVLFFVFGGLLFFGLVCQKSINDKGWALWVYFSIIGVGYAILTEYIQWAFINSRKGSLWDALANILGLYVGVWLANRIIKKQKNLFCRFFQPQKD